MFASIKKFCDDLTGGFEKIPANRKVILEKIAAYIKERHRQNIPVNLLYVCTHNSRRSHYGQVWAKVASVYYNFPEVNVFSGGTEATAFHLNAINALKRIGFDIKIESNLKNPVYEVYYDANKKPVECFSKVYNDQKNPSSHFAAIMTCIDAEENCPFIPGAELRISLTYDDPKAFDNTNLQDLKYDERCRQIALETLYIFSKAK